MYQKKLNEKLNFHECIQLLTLCVEKELLHLDKNNENNILVYRSAGEVFPEGWYSQNLMSVASELTDNVKGQELLRTTLLEMGVAIQFERNPFIEDSLKEKKKIIERD